MLPRPPTRTSAENLPRQSLGHTSVWWPGRQLLRWCGPSYSTKTWKIGSFMLISPVHYWATILDSEVTIMHITTAANVSNCLRFSWWPFMRSLCMIVWGRIMTTCNMWKVFFHGVYSAPVDPSDLLPVITNINLEGTVYLKCFWWKKLHQMMLIVSAWTIGDQGWNTL